MIDRPDWNFDNKGQEVIPSDAQKSHEQLIHEMESYTGPKGVAASTPANPVTPATANKSGLPDFNYDRQGREMQTTPEHGLPPEIVKEMHASAEGYDAQLATMQASATKVIQEMPPNFAEHFDTLSPSI